MTTIRTIPIRHPVFMEQCAHLLHGNQIRSRGFRYTRPAPMVYEYQWLWDSCFHAIVYRWFNPGMARDELLSVVEHQVTEGDDAGMIPHMAYWNGDGSDLWGQRRRSIITQPPLIAVAAWLVHQRHPDLDFLAALFPRLVQVHAWFNRRRDPDGDHLVTLIHPWESGWDAHPRWDAPMGLEHPTDEQSKAARHALVAQLRAQGCHAERLQAAGSFAVEALDFNAIRAADLEALADIADALGADGALWRAEAGAVQQAVQHKLLSTEVGADLSGPDETPLLGPSAAPFIALFGGCARPEQAAALVAQLTAAHFWTVYPVPTTPSDDPHFAEDRYWRGNVWPSVNWLIYRGLLRYGYAEEARHLANQTLQMVQQNGFHEYFNPLSGQGYGPAQQSWSTLALDMAESAPA
ncbi:MAG: hypothetical protein HC915_09990 [Anaerolineae bacterium]|nr:hypothetical protein [Anaerolineae bacterium]